ncbi:MAG TPA: OmpA family protein [Bacteroidia bacterium]|nr:OmpA family protein [Bacteroidia bacterium]
MKLIKVLSVVVVFLLAFSVNGHAQKNYVRDADRAYESQQYYNAVELYKKGISKIKNKQEKARITFQIAECYRKMNDWKQAESWYGKAIKAKHNDDKMYLWYAEALKINMKYDEAVTAFTDYKTRVPSDPAGENGIKSSELSQQWKDNPTRYVVENMAQINSKDYDFSPTYSDKKHTSIIFTSKREGQTGSKVDPISGTMYSDLFETKVDKNGKWSAPATITGSVNSAMGNEGASCVNKKADKIYFTRCDQQKKKWITCKIYVSSKKGNSWDTPELIDFSLDAAVLDSFNFRHPTISSDETVMVFSSDMTGTTGGIHSDLWMSTYDKKAKKWGKPVNLGTTINTDGREGFPYISEAGDLYYSSDGLLGMGGLDIFKAPLTDAKNWKWGTPENLKYPMNSPGDDFGIVFDGKKEKGYLTSNREGTKGADDIWSFYLPPLVFHLAGTVTDCKYGPTIAVQTCTVRLVGSDGSAVEAVTDKDGKYKFDLNPEVSYVVTVFSDKGHSTKAEGYLNLPDKDKGKLTTVGEMNSKDFTLDFCLQPAESEIRFPAVLYALNHSDLLVDSLGTNKLNDTHKPINSKDSLNFLYQTLIDNPTIVIELSAHTDSRASDAYNMKLSQARAQACVDYLVSKGIPKERMKAVGYGESRPLKLADGTILTEKYILSKKTKQEQEALFIMNRRTVFKVLSWDYVDPKAPKDQNPRQIIHPKVLAGAMDEYGDSTATDDSGGGTGTGTGGGTTGGGTTGTTTTTQPHQTAMNSAAILRNSFAILPADDRRYC